VVWEDGGGDPASFPIDYKSIMGVAVYDRITNPIERRSAMKCHCRISTPLGVMMALAEQGALCGLWFTDGKYTPVSAGEWLQDPDLQLFAVLREQLDAYFTGTLREFDLPLAPRGTPFRMAVWDLLRTIPFGSTTTYGTLSRQLAAQREGRRPAAQAVGGAVGHNPLTIIIPCHRVIGSDGSLTGYAGGLERKAALLALEKG
jgi:methylated-DNA-[protein]-cysteine S-methyltransferase